MDPQLIANSGLLEARARGGMIAVEDAVFRIEGPGTVSCLQGLLTNDLQKIGPHGLVWGALLTPKGLILTDAWVARDGDAAWVIVPASARALFADIARRALPPRLARTIDRSDDLAVRWVLGEPATAEGVFVARPSEQAPFDALLVGPRSALDALPLAELPPEVAVLQRVLGGWPTLGREIDEKTLVQEVRFDELQGVKYDKGCYTGQETVARLHFRGHANRTLRAIVGQGRTLPIDGHVRDAGGREVATVSTFAVIDGRWIAMAKIRREVETGATVVVGAAEGRVMEFPITP